MPEGRSPWLWHWVAQVEASLPPGIQRHHWPLFELIYSGGVIQSWADSRTGMLSSDDVEVLHDKVIEFMTSSLTNKVLLVNFNSSVCSTQQIRPVIPEDIRDVIADCPHEIVAALIVVATASKGVLLFLPLRAIVSLMRISTCAFPHISIKSGWMIPRIVGLLLHLVTLLCLLYAVSMRLFAMLRGISFVRPRGYAMSLTDSFPFRRGVFPMSMPDFLPANIAPGSKKRALCFRWLIVTSS